MKKVIFLLLSGAATKVYQISAFLLSAADYLEDKSMRLDMFAANYYEEKQEEEYIVGEEIIGV